MTNDIAIFDSIPLDHLKHGRRYLIERKNDVPLAGCFAGFREPAGRGYQLGVILMLSGGEFELVKAGEIESIKFSER